MGYSSALVTGVWVGNDSGRPLGQKETGSRAALPIWREIMENVLPESNAEEFDQPATVNLLRIDVRSGLRANGDCGDVAEAAFVKTTEPKEHCPDGRDQQLGKFH